MIYNFGCIYSFLYRYYFYYLSIIFLSIKIEELDGLAGVAVYLHPAAETL